MKKIQLVALILILCLAGTYNSSAQDDSGGSGTKFSYGGQVGSSFSGFSRFGQTFSLKRLGVTGGMFAQYSVLPFASVSLEVNYAMAGATEVSPDLVYNYNPNVTYPHFGAEMVNRCIATGHSGSGNY